MILRLAADPRRPRAALGDVLDHRQFHRGGLCARPRLRRPGTETPCRRRRPWTRSPAPPACRAASASSAASTPPPRRARSSAMFRITSVGRPRLSTGAASTRWRLRLVESRISRTASGSRQILHLAQQHVVRDALVFGARSQAVDARQIDHENVAAGIELDLAHAMLHRDAGKVRHLLAQAGEPVEQSRFAGIGRPDDRHDAPLDEAAARRQAWSPAEQSWQSLILPFSVPVRSRYGGSASDCGLAPQRHFRAVHAKHPRVAAGRRMRRRDRVPGQKSHLHQPPRVLLRQVDALEHTVFAALQLRQVAGALWLQRRGGSF